MTIELQTQLVPEQSATRTEPNRVAKRDVLRKSAFLCSMSVTEGITGWNGIVKR